MTLYQVVLCATFACLVTALPRPSTVDRSSWNHTATILSQTTVTDGSLKPICFVNITIDVYNYVNFTQEARQLVVDRVRGKLAKIPVDSESPHDDLNVYYGEMTKLPKALNMSEFVMIQTGPAPFTRAVFTLLHLDVYAKKKHRADVLASLKNIVI